jgi:hypothetical protein
MHLQNKITERAAASYYELIPQCNTIETFISYITLQYGSVGVSEVVITQLRKIKHLQAESIIKFGQRVQRLCAQLLAIIKASGRRS